MTPVRVQQAVRPLGLVLLACAIALGSWMRVAELYELTALDIRFHLRPPVRVDPAIVLIEISDDTITQIGRWPFERSWHAVLIDALTAAGARAIVFDVLFVEPADDDAVMADSLQNAAPVYLPYALQSLPVGTVSGPVPVIAPLSERFVPLVRGSGYINTVADPDGKIRRVPLRISPEKDAVSLGVRVAADYSAGTEQDTDHGMGAGTLLINYAGRWERTFRHYSYIDVLKSYERTSTGQEPAAFWKTLRGAVCFVGYSAAGTYDRFSTPYDAAYPGVGIQANIFNTLTTGQFIRRAGRGVNLCLVLLLCLVSFVTGRRARPLVSAGLHILLAAGFTALAVCLFAGAGIWIDVVYPLVVVILFYLGRTVAHYAREQHTRSLIEKELTVARTIQQSFLPQAMPAVPGLSVAARMLTAKKVGGDLYDALRRDPHLAVMIGDVSGKGVPAALYMAHTVSNFRIYAQQPRAPGEVLLALNRDLLQSAASNLFVTMSYVLFSPADHTMVFSSAGHLPIVHYHARQRTCSRLDVSEGLPLGLFEGEYPTREEKVFPGDLLVLYTDGITEAMDPAGELFGIERLEETVLAAASGEPEGIITAVLARVGEFTRHAPPQDDTTIMVVRVNG